MVELLASSRSVSGMYLSHEPFDEVPYRSFIVVHMMHSKCIVGNAALFQISEAYLANIRKSNNACLESHEYGTTPASSRLVSVVFPYLQQA